MKIVNKKNITISMGILAIAESVLAMNWKTNDRTNKAQVARLCRISGGLLLIFMELYHSKRTTNQEKL